MTGRLLGAACALLMVGACSEPSESTDPDDPDNPAQVADPAAPTVEAARILFAPEYPAARMGAYETAFDIIDTKQIVVEVPVHEEPGIHYVKLDVYRPIGTLYQTYWRGFTADADPPEFAPHPTVEGEIRVRPVERVFGKAVVYLRIPITGSRIQQFGVTGDFRAEARFGDGSGPAIAVGGFAITMPEGM